MRTRLGDHLAPLRRPAALAALAAAAGGIAAAMAPRLPLWRLVADVRALETNGAQDMAVLDGAATTPWTAAIALVGVVAVVIAVLVALDRPPPLAEQLLVAIAALLVAAAGLLLLDRPPPAAFDDVAAVAELRDEGTALPAGVEIELHVEPDSGIALLGLAGLLVAAGTLVALRRG